MVDKDSSAIKLQTPMTDVTRKKNPALLPIGTSLIAAGQLEPLWPQLQLKA